MAIQFVIMIVWTVVDPYSSVVIHTSDFAGVNACQSNHATLWLSLQSVYFGVLLVLNKKKNCFFDVFLDLERLYHLFNLVNSHIYCGISLDFNRNV